MRDNGPITNREIEFPADALLVSSTDTAGRITFVNSAFMDVSGYSWDELVGKPHNMVRHPHMPPEAFADLWVTLKAGKPWEGIVKNRCKNGDHYWVKASITPVMEAGGFVGCLSVRTKPSREEVAKAEALYARFREGPVKDVVISEGHVEGTALRSRLRRNFQKISWRLNTVFAVLLLVMTGFGAASLTSMYMANNNAKALYEDGAVLLNQLGRLRDMVRDNGYQFTLLDVQMSKGDDTKKRLETIKKNLGNIDKSFEDLPGWLKTDEEKEAGGKLIEAYRTFAGEFVMPAMEAAEKNDGKALEKLIFEKMQKRYNAIKTAQVDLDSIEIRHAGEEYEGQKAVLDYLVVILPSVFLVALVFVVGARFILLNSVRRPVERMTIGFGAISQADYFSDLPVEPVAEFMPIMAMLRATRMKMAYLLNHQKETDDWNAITRTEETAALAGQFEQRVKTVVDGIGASSVRLADTARTLSANVGETVQQSSNVHSQTEEVARNVQAVSAATYELSSSVSEISRQVSHAAGIAKEAVDQARDTNTIMEHLTEAAGKIGEVVSLIANIASQTNLLALNATIEAARAGDAGKGFAVVASEVKALANQTAQATKEIGTQIGEMQGETKVAVNAIGAISKTIANIDELSSAIAAAVEQQGAATAQIADSVERAAGATDSVVSSIRIVSQAANESGEMSGLVAAAAESLKDDSITLERGITDFLAEVRKK